jgi:hypothetical protein
VAPSGNPEWSIRLTVENKSDRKLAPISWACRRYPWDTDGSGIHGNWGVMLESGDVAPHSTKSWNFRVTDNSLGENLPYCKTIRFEWWR